MAKKDKKGKKDKKSKACAQQDTCCASEQEQDQKRVVPEHKLFKKHDGHDEHLCELVRGRQMDRVAELSKGAAYVCHICGRAAATAESLCEPVEV